MQKFVRRTCVPMSVFKLHINQGVLKKFSQLQRFFRRPSKNSCPSPPLNIDCSLHNNSGRKDFIPQSSEEQQESGVLCPDLWIPRSNVELAIIINKHVLIFHGFHPVSLDILFHEALLVYPVNTHWKFFHLKLSFCVLQI